MEPEVILRPLCTHTQTQEHHSLWNERVWYQQHSSFGLHSCGQWSLRRQLHPSHYTVKDDRALLCSHLPLHREGLTQTSRYVRHWRVCGQMNRGMDENMWVRKGKNGVLLRLCWMPPSVFLPVIDTGTLSFCPSAKSYFLLHTPSLLGVERWPSPIVDGVSHPLSSPVTSVPSWNETTKILFISLKDRSVPYFLQGVSFEPSVCISPRAMGFFHDL